MELRVGDGNMRFCDASVKLAPEVRQHTRLHVTKHTSSLEKAFKVRAFVIRPRDTTRERDKVVVSARERARSSLRTDRLLVKHTHTQRELPANLGPRVIRKSQGGQEVVF
jgi:hypothetical protein